MKEFCTFFKLALIEDIVSVSQQNIELLPDKDFAEFSADSLSLSVKSDSQNAGVVYSVSQDIIIDKVTPEIAATYMHLRSAVMLVQFTDGSYEVLGNLDYPVMVLLTRDIQKDILNISLKTTIRPIL